ncbi:MAG: haloacid dehalogenase [Bacillales bacterium]|jgi:Cof subfamily protein (haloacid dehalogenase superfamily)|nr:haloacid dehalogenase [Bacillales bacterium]
MFFKLLAINIDGTLLRSNGSLPKQTREAINFVQNKEVVVTLVTSRNFPSAQKVARALQIPSLLVTHSGAFIADDIDEPYIDRRISPMRTFQIAQALDFYDCNVRVITERFTYANRKKLDVNLIAKAVFTKNDPIFYPVQFFDSISDVLRDEEISTPKIEVLFDNPLEKFEAINTLNKSFNDINIINVNNEKIEIVPAGVSKLWGLQQLGKKLSIPLSEMVVIGDGLDDKDMLENVGLGVAMWNSLPEVKKAADWVTRSNDENGVTYMVREHFRKQQRIQFVRKMTRS